MNLTVREREVLEGVVAGDSNAKIGVRLFLGDETIKTHVKTLFWKLGARNRTNLAVIAVRRGLVDVDVDGNVLASDQRLG